MQPDRDRSNLQHGLLVVLSIALFCVATTSLACMDMGLALVSLIGALVTAAAGLLLRPKEGRAREGCLLGATWLLFGLLAVVFLTGHPGDGTYSPRTRCISNIKQLALGMLMYAADFDDRFPPANAWHGAIQPYTKLEDLFHCPVATSAWSYAMDSSMSMVLTESEKKPERQVLLFEANATLPNASGGREWLAPRHESGKEAVANIGFVDGHGKRFTFAEAATLKW